MHPFGLEHAGDEVALDGFAFAPGRETQREGRDAVDVAQAPRGLVEKGDGVGGEEVLAAANADNAHAYVVGRVLRGEGSDR